MPNWNTEKSVNINLLTLSLLAWNSKWSCAALLFTSMKTHFYALTHPCPLVTLSLSLEHQLHHRFTNMDDDDMQQPPPLPPRTSFERTITVVRGNRSLGMFSVFLMVVVSWCVYLAGMAIMTLIGGGDDDCPEEE